jgi:hypothetical protein
MVTNLGSRNVFFALAIIAGLLLVSFLLAPVVPPAVDWRISFRPAALTLLSGQSPYDKVYIIHEPWALLMLAPFALLPENVGRVMLLFCGLISYTFIAHRLGAKPIAILFLLISPVVMHMLLNGNIDWLASFGFILPPQIGLFFIAIKPQIGIAVAPFWLVEAWREGGWRQVLTTFVLFTVVRLLSFAIFGLWPLGATEVTGVYFNASLWPLSIPVGLALFVTAIRKRKIEYVMAASSCLSPYALFYS